MISSLPAATALISDIWSPEGGRIEREEGAGFADLLRRVTQMVRGRGRGQRRVRRGEGKLGGGHYRLVVERDRPRITDLVDRVLASHPRELRMTSWEDGVGDPAEARVGQEHGLCSRLSSSIVMACCRCMSATTYSDEDAFRALIGYGIGMLVADSADPELAGRQTAAEYSLWDPAEVENVLGALAR